METCHERSGERKTDLERGGPSRPRLWRRGDRFCPADGVAFRTDAAQHEAGAMDYAIWLGVVRAANELLKPEPDFGEWIQ
jgi:hypothetical protein